MLLVAGVEVEVDLVDFEGTMTLFGSTLLLPLEMNSLEVAEWDPVPCMCVCVCVCVCVICSI